MNENSLLLFQCKKNRHRQLYPDTINLEIKNKRSCAMSINNSILKILNLKEENVIFKENFVEERKIKEKRSLIFI